MNLLNELFPHKFCINLDRRLDRWQDVTKEFDKFGITNVTRWSAFDGSTINDSQYMRRGEIGCTRSHSSLMQHCLDNNIDEVLIFEDDVVFSPFVIDLFNQSFKDIPNDWQMIYLGGNHYHGGLISIKNNIYRMTHTYAMHGYIIRTPAMEWMVENCKDERYISDVYAAQYHAIAPCYTFLPVLAFQKADYSDLQEGYRNYDHLLKIGVNE